MDIQAFLSKHSQNNTTTMLADGLKQIGNRLDSQQRAPPAHLDDQRRRIHSLFDTDETVWLFFFDGGRYDIFQQLYREYLSGELEQVYNGGIGYTGDWFDRNMRYDFGNRGFFTLMPIRHQNHVDYDGRNYFEIAPDLRNDIAISERLAHLGYKEQQSDATLDVDPRKINAAVRDNRNLNGGVIRYLKPHPPFDGIEDLSSGRSKTSKTRQAIENGQLTHAELTNSYIQTYRTAFESACKLIPELDGRVVITADHGECLTCGQLYHGRNHDKHDHLTNVPWFEVEQ